MQKAITTMLTMQHRVNQHIHKDWITQGFPWYRAIWVECAELMDHIGYKWWKKQTADTAQIHLEVVDIWHFGMSSLLVENASVADTVQRITKTLNRCRYQGQSLRTSTEALAQHALEKKTFSLEFFWHVMQAAQLPFDELYRHYVGKNVLNGFRQDHGYKEGTYRKQWQGREDNEHLADILSTLDSQLADFSDAVYQALAARYQEQEA